MKLRVLFFPRISSRDTADPRTILDDCSQRKFIVLRGAEEVVVVIGPYCYDHSYYHRELFNISSGGVSGAKVSGGGYFRIVNSGPEGAPAAVLYDSSGSYGSFDDILKEEWAMEELQNAIGVSAISFGA